MCDLHVHRVQQSRCAKTRLQFLRQTPTRFQVKISVEENSSESRGQKLRVFFKRLRCFPCSGTAECISCCVQLFLVRLKCCCSRVVLRSLEKGPKASNFLHTVLNAKRERLSSEVCEYPGFSGIHSGNLRTGRVSRAAADGDILPRVRDGALGIKSALTSALAGASSHYRAP